MKHLKWFTIPLLVSIGLAGTVLIIEQMPTETKSSAAGWGAFLTLVMAIVLSGFIYESD